MAPIGNLVDPLLVRLAWTSLQAALLVAIVAVVVRVLPRLPAAARSALWWLVGLQAIVGLACYAPIPLPLLAPAAPAVTIGRPVDATSHRTVSVRAKAAVTAASPQRSIEWRDALALLWLLGVLAPVPAMLRDRRRLRRWVRESEPAGDDLLRRCRELADEAGLRHCPRLRVSPAITSPLVTGWLHPVMMWPAGAAFTPAETSLALAHELAHVKRGDLWFGCIPAVAQRLFFFHPLLRRAVREYAAQREAACDALALRACNADAGDYASLLFRLGVAGSGAAALGGASETFRSLKSRLLMLEQSGRRVPGVVAWLLVALIAVVGVSPYRVVAAPAGRAAVSPAEPYTGAAGAADCGPNYVRADNIPFCGAKTLVYTAPGKPGEGVVMFDEGTVAIAGDHADVVAAKAFYQRGVNLLWFHRGGKTYLTHDSVILRRAGALVTSELARTQAGLAALNKLVAQQSSLVDRQGKIVSRQAALASEEGKLARLQAATSDPLRSRDLAARIHDRQAEVAALQSEITGLQGQIDALQQRILARQAQLRAERRAEPDASSALATGLAKLATASLAGGTAEAVGR